MWMDRHSWAFEDHGDFDTWNWYFPMMIDNFKIATNKSMLKEYQDMNESV